jgi:hypothetical protein
MALVKSKATGKKGSRKSVCSKGKELRGGKCLKLKAKGKHKGKATVKRASGRLKGGK